MPRLQKISTKDLYWIQDDLTEVQLAVTREIRNRTQTGSVSAHRRQAKSGASEQDESAQVTSKYGLVGVGTRGLTVFLAHKMRSPSAQTRKRMDFDGYLIAYYPDDAFDEKMFKALKGYSGSTNDHFFVNDGLHRLATRNERCPCRECITNE